MDNLNQEIEPVDLYLNGFSTALGADFAHRLPMKGGILPPYAVMSHQVGDMIRSTFCEPEQ